jgi:hypothetical protein
MNNVNKIQRSTVRKRIIFGFIAFLLTVLVTCASSAPPAPQQQASPNERLLIAAADGSLSRVKSSLADGANVNAKRSNGTTALHSACSRGYFEIVQYLVENGADMNIRGGEDNDTPLIWAVYNERNNISKFLIDNGANINSRDKHGKSALNYAYERGEMDIHNYLKERGAIEFEPIQIAQQPAPAPQIYSYEQPSAPVTSPNTVSSGPTAAQRVQEALRSPLDSGTYSLVGTQAKISITAIAKSGILYYTNQAGRRSSGTYSIDGTRMTVRVEGYTFLYSITRQTSFSGNGETWVRTGF